MLLEILRSVRFCRHMSIVPGGTIVVVVFVSETGLGRKARFISRGAAKTSEARPVSSPEGGYSSAVYVV